MQTVNPIKSGQLSVILRVKLHDSTVTTQAGKTALFARGDRAVCADSLTPAKNDRAK